MYSELFGHLFAGSSPGNKPLGRAVAASLKCPRSDTPPRHMWYQSVHAVGADDESAPEELAKALRKIMAGGRYVSPALAEMLALGVTKDLTRTPHETLSDREYEVMSRIASGKTVTEIAEELSLSPKTISTYRARVLEKLGLKNSAAIVQYVIRNGLVIGERPKCRGGRPACNLLFRPSASPQRQTPTTNAYKSFGRRPTKESGCPDGHPMAQGSIIKFRRKRTSILLIQEKQGRTMIKRMMGSMATLLVVCGSGFASSPPVNLGKAGTFAILTKTGITDVYASAVTGDVGTSPITGAALLLTCTEVSGNVYSVDAAGPLPCVTTDATLLTGAVGDMEFAYLDAAGRTSPNFTELGAGEIGGLTLAPGLYKWGTDVSISTDVTLSGGPTDVWIFQISGRLNEANAARVTLAGGALAKNIFWQVAGAVTLGTTAHFEGVVLAKTLIAVNTGATVNGRLLAQTAVTLQMNAITQPAK